MSKQYGAKIFNVFSIFTRLPWIFDLLVSIITLTISIYLLWIIIQNKETASTLDLIISLLTFLYSSGSAYSKWISDKIEMDAFKLMIEPALTNCQNVASSHYNETDLVFNDVTERVINTQFHNWKKHKNIKSFEYEIINSYTDHLATNLSMDEGDRLFLKYRIVTSDFSIHFPKLVLEIDNGDFYTPGSPFNKFIKKVYLFTIDPSTTFNEINSLTLNNEQIKDTTATALQKSNQYIEELLKENKSKEKIQYLLNKCYENAYTNIGSLDANLKDDAQRNLVFMFKYDERFSILKRIWHTEIRNHLAKKFAKSLDLEIEYKKAEDKLDKIMLPQPFSKAIKEFDYCIYQVGKDKFSFIVDPLKFGDSSAGLDSEKFLKDVVIPRAQFHLDEFNKKLVKEFSYLKEHRKKTLDANRYLFFFNRKHFQYSADQSAIPLAIKRFLIKEILDSENAAEQVASQLVYVKQIINKLSISGLLFTESIQTQRTVQEKETKINSSAKKSGIVITDINEIASIGNKLEMLVSIFYEAIYGKKLRRKTGKDYKFIKNTVGKIVTNAQDLIKVFNTLRASEVEAV